MFAFPDHAQSIEYIVHRWTSFMFISRMIHGNRMHLSSISVRANSQNTSEKWIPNFIIRPELYRKCLRCVILKVLHCCTQVRVFTLFCFFCYITRKVGWGEYRCLTPWRTYITSWSDDDGNVPATVLFKNNFYLRTTIIFFAMIHYSFILSCQF